MGEGRDPWFDTVLPLNSFSDHTSFTSVRRTVTWIPAFAGMTELHAPHVHTPLHTLVIASLAPLDLSGRSFSVNGGNIAWALVVADETRLV
jgi:hypothetical protein